jgi:hypothetical protein
MKRFLQASFLFLLLCSLRVFAQYTSGTVEVGPYFAYQHWNLSGDEKIENEKSFPSVQGKTLSGITAGIMAEYHLSSIFSLQSIVRYEELNENLSVPGAANLYSLSNGYKIEAEMGYTYQIIAPQIVASLTGKFIIPGTGLSILIGGSAGILIGDEQKIHYNLQLIPKYPMLTLDSLPIPIPAKIRGQTTRFTDDTHKSVLLYSGEIYQRQPLQFGLTGGFQYNIPLFPINESKTKFVTLTPCLIYRMNLTNYSSFGTFIALTWDIGMALKVGL